MAIIKLLSLFVLLSNIITVFVVVFFLLSRYGLNKTLWKKISTAIKKYSLWLIFSVSLSAMLGSLYFSEVKGYYPCKLCWFQRIFMYPQVFIVGLALFKKTKDVFKYTLLLSVIGLLIAVYHYKIQLGGSSLLPCSISGFSESCEDKPFIYFGFITIPWMSASVFLINSLVSFLNLKPVKKE